MPTKTIPKPKPKPKTKTTTTVNRRKNSSKRKHRSWLWWILFLLPIVITAWLYMPSLDGAQKQSLKTTNAVERVESMEMPTMARSRPSSASRPDAAEEAVEEPTEGIIADDVQEDVDWAMGHMYKLLPIVISLIALLKKGVIMGRSS
jgi:hypothetical protein